MGVLYPHLREIEQRANRKMDISQKIRVFLVRICLYSTPNMLAYKYENRKKPNNQKIDENSRKSTY